MKYKHFIKITLLSILAFSFVRPTPAKAQDIFYNNDATSYVLDAGRFIYKQVITIDSLASGDIHYSKAVFLPGHVDFIFFRAVASDNGGTEDFNLFPVYIADPKSAVANFIVEATDSDLDAIGTTAVEDTLGYIQGTVSKKKTIYPWLIWKSVNGDAITATGTLTIEIGGVLADGVNDTDIPSPTETKEE